MRKLLMVAMALMGAGLVLLLLANPWSPAAPTEADRDASTGIRQAQGPEKRSAVPRPEHLEGVGEAAVDADGTPWVEEVPSEEDGLLEVEVLASEQPVPRARVRLYLRGPWDPNLNEVSWRLAGTGVTDAQGRARLASRPGGYLVAVRSPGLAPLLREVVRPQNEARTALRLNLEPGQSLSGYTVEQGTLEPLPGVELRVRRYSNGQEAWQRAEAPAEERVYASSDARGAFRVEGLAPGAYALEARAPGYAKRFIQRVVLPAAGPLTVELLAAGVIEGFVVDARGHPAAGAEVHVGSKEPTLTTTGSGGGFAVEVAPGSHFVSARRGGEAGALATPVILSAGKTVRDVRIQLGQSAALEGSVVARGTGAPIASARVEVSPHGKSGDFGRAVTDDRGRFSLEGLAPGSYDLLVRAEGFTPLPRRALTVASGERFPLTLSLIGTGAVEGFVRDGTGRPMPGAQVVGHDFWGGMWGLTPAEARTDGEGHYLLEGLSAGSVNLVARPAGATIGVGQVVDIPEGGLARQDFTLEEPGTVEGQIRAARGELTTEPLMVLASPRGRAGAALTDFRPIAVDATGAFRMTLQPGSYELSVSLAEHWPFGDSESTTVEIEPGKTVQVELLWQSQVSQRASLRGVVLEPDGTPSPEAFVTLLPEQGSRGPYLNAPADAQGRFAFSLSEGEASREIRLRVVARSGGRVGELRGVRLGEQDIAVRLRPAVTVRGRVVRASGEAPVKGFTLSVESQEVRSYVFDQSTLEFPGDSFELRDIPTEPVRLVVRTADGLGGMTLVDPGSGAVPELEIPVRGTAGVRGRVLARSTRKPLPGAFFFIAEDRPLNPETATGADGRFTLEGAIPGERTLVIMSNGNFAHLDVTLEEGQVADVGDILVGSRYLDARDP